MCSGSVLAVDCQTILSVYSPATLIPQTTTQFLSLFQTAATTQILSNHMNPTFAPNPANMSTADRAKVKSKLNKAMLIN